MTSSTPVILVLACLTIGGHGVLGDSSYIIWDLVSLFSGNWTNRAHIEAGLSKHDLIQTRTVPVAVPVLYPDVVVLVENLRNGKLFSRTLEVVRRDEKDVSIVYTISYTFTDARKNKSGELNPGDLYNVTMADLHKEENCMETYVRLSKDLFSGMCFLCSNDGQHRPLGITVTCDVYTVASPFSTPVPPPPSHTCFGGMGRGIPS